MRDVEYRGRWKDNGKWVYGAFFNHIQELVCFSEDKKPDKALIIQDGFCDWGFEPPIQAIEVIPETVGQWTGLVDKNIVKIFEGDKCFIYTDNIDEEDGYFVVKYDVETARFVCESDSLIVDFDNITSKEVDVVGTIFDEEETE